MADMTDEQKKDLQPILKSFPFTTLDDHGGPVMKGTFRDAEDDIVGYTISHEGILEFGGVFVSSNLLFFLLNSEILDDLSYKCKVAKRLAINWEQTESGKAWNIAITE